jgi:hypothetical protein
MGWGWLSKTVGALGSPITGAIGYLGGEALDRDEERQKLLARDTRQGELDAMFKEAPAFGGGALPRLEYNSGWEDLMKQQIGNEQQQQVGNLAAQSNAQRQMGLSGAARFGGAGGGASSILGAQLANQEMQKRQQTAMGAQQQRLGVGVEGERQRMDINKYNIANELKEREAQRTHAMDIWKQKMAARSAEREAEAMENS